MSVDINRNKTICVTGLRRHKLLWDSDKYAENSIILSDAIKKVVVPFIIEGYNNFLCGMASGSDLIFAKAILELKETYSDIMLQAIVPFINQDEKFSVADKIEYKQIIEKCDVIKIIDNEYTVTSYKKRNSYMIDNSSILIAITNNPKLHKSGTTQTINLAKKSCLDIIQINSDDFAVTTINAENLKLF